MSLVELAETLRSIMQANTSTGSRFSYLQDSKGRLVLWNSQLICDSETGRYYLLAGAFYCIANLPESVNIILQGRQLACNTPKIITRQPQELFGCKEKFEVLINDGI